MNIIPERQQSLCVSRSIGVWLKALSRDYDTQRFLLPKRSSRIQFMQRRHSGDLEHYSTSYDILDTTISYTKASCSR